MVLPWPRIGNASRRPYVIPELLPPPFRRTLPIRNHKPQQNLIFFFLTLAENFNLFCRESFELRASNFPITPHRLTIKKNRTQYSKRQMLQLGCNCCILAEKNRIADLSHICVRDPSSSWHKLEDQPRVVIIPKNKLFL